jgi:glycosyltransferase involved in cell wall biosynthesis
VKVLVSAYACAPGRGSEPEVGLRSVLAAASRHDTWVLTREKNVAPLRRYLLEHHPQVAARTEVVGLDIDGPAKWLKKRVPGGLYLYYGAWQRSARDRARELDARHDFDLVHHSTFATFWTRAGVCELGKPAVWGPVGGGVRPPRSLLPVMGARGVVRSVARAVVQRFGLLALERRMRASGAAVVALAQNSETAALIRRVAPAAVVPNALVVEPRETGPTGKSRSGRRVVFASRLVPYKAGLLAVRAMTHVAVDAELLICGDGPERARLLREIERLGLTGRVRVLGAVPREQMQEILASATALLHPALHDDAALVVAEALGMGTVVVCLDHGGPREVTRWWPAACSRLVRVADVEGTARGLAAALEDVLGAPPAPSRTLSPSRRYEDLLLEAYTAAAGAAAHPPDVGPPGGP